MTLPYVLLAPLKAVPRREQLAGTVALIVAGLMLIASMLTLPRYYALPKQDFIGARDYVEQNRRPGEAIVAVGLAGEAYRRYYAPSWLMVRSKAELDTIQREHSDTWLVYTIPAQLDALRPDYWSAVQKEFKVVKVFPGTLNGGDIFICISASVPRQHSAGTAQVGQRMETTLAFDQ
jgi:hypothetical protein